MNDRAGSVDKDIVAYINSITPPEAGGLGKLQKDAYEEGLPIIPPETVSLLKVLLAVQKPRRVLEIGCAVGFSASLIAKMTANDGRITTIDRYPYMINRARENFKKLDTDGKIKLIEGDAAHILPLLTDRFDFIFMDAAKGQYLQLLPDCLRLLNVGGLLVCDDVLQNGIHTDRLQVPRRQRTTHDRMRAFLEIIMNSVGLESSILTVGGGVSISVKLTETVELKGLDNNE